MNNEPALSPLSAGFLIIVGLVADTAKILLDALFGVGIILDPFIVTPVTALVFGIVLTHNGMSMFSGRRAWAGWANLIFSFVPVLDFLPDWTAYAIFLAATSWMARRANAQ
jgi:hypothetical protein